MFIITDKHGVTRRSTGIKLRELLLCKNVLTLVNSRGKGQKVQVEMLSAPSFI